MNKILIIAKREIASYFVSPVAYIVIAVFLCLSGYFYYGSVIFAGQSGMEEVFYDMSVILMFLTPLITMRLIAEEKKLGTIELLYTAPVSLSEVILGKYLASVFLLAAMLVLTFPYPLVVAFYSQADWGPVFLGYAGVFLIGMTFLSVGIFGSSLTENQVIAAAVTFTGIFFLCAVGWLEALIGGKYLIYLSVLDNLEDFARGVLDTKNIAFYAGLIFTFLWLTVRRLEWKRW